MVMMKKQLFGCIALVALTACANKKWEYNTVRVQTDVENKFSPREVSVSNRLLDSMGNERWELVGMYNEIETVHPNFGDEHYVTGLQPNVRTLDVSFVFKRRK